MGVGDQIFLRSRAPFFCRVRTKTSYFRICPNPSVLDCSSESLCNRNTQVEPLIKLVKHKKIDSISSAKCTLSLVTYHITILTSEHAGKTYYSSVRRSNATDKNINLLCSFINVWLKFQAMARFTRAENKLKKLCYYIDGCNLFEDCTVTLQEVQQEAQMVLPESRAQYNLIPARKYEPQVFNEICSMVCI